MTVKEEKDRDGSVQRFGKRVGWKSQMRQLLGNMWCNVILKKKKLLLVTEVGIVLVVSAQVSMVRGRGTKEDGGRQVVSSVFEELVHLTWNTRLNGHSVTFKKQAKPKKARFTSLQMFVQVSLLQVMQLHM